jgi:hypothetical protein
LRRGFIAVDYLFADRHQRARRPDYALDVVARAAPGLPHWTVGTPWTRYTMAGRRVIELAPLSPPLPTGSS